MLTCTDEMNVFDKQMRINRKQENKTPRQDMSNRHKIGCGDRRSKIGLVSNKLNALDGRVVAIRLFLFFLLVC